MQAQIKEIENYTDKHGMKVNVDKTKSILFNTSRKLDFLPEMEICNRKI